MLVPARHVVPQQLWLEEQRVKMASCNGSMSQRSVVRRADLVIFLQVMRGVFLGIQIAEAVSVCSIASTINAEMYVEWYSSGRLTRGNIATSGNGGDSASLFCCWGAANKLGRVYFMRYRIWLQKIIHIQSTGLVNSQKRDTVYQNSVLSSYIPAVDVFCKVDCYSQTFLASASLNRWRSYFAMV